MAGGRRKDIGDLLAIMAALRTPVTGCPWDLEQTFATIAPYTVEEAYEVADAIERGDPADLKEELGDLLLQVVYHARMAEEAGEFNFADVVDGIAMKMLRRHPHVFDAEALAHAGEIRPASDRARSAGVAKERWEEIKAEEQRQKAAERSRLGAGASSQPGGLLADVPAGMPGLTRAIKLQHKAAKVGFDWPGVGPVLAKVREEIAELEAELAAVTGSAPQDRAPIADEYGDLLFVMANLARHLTIDPEAALRRANQKFIRRFGHIETRLAEMGRTPAQSTLDEMEALWVEAKAREKGRAPS